MSAPAVLFTSKSDEWPTPRWLFERLHREFKFTVDACANAGNTKLPRYWTREDNALVRPWDGERVWCNPPYSGVAEWCRKARAERHALTVLLVPSRTDTRWWHELAPHCEVRLLRGRIKFHDTNPAPFPSALLVHGAEVTPRLVHVPKD